MLFALPVLRRLAASILLASFVLSPVSFAATTTGAMVTPSSIRQPVCVTPQPETHELSNGTIELTTNKSRQAPILLAHHEASVGASQLLTTGASTIASTVSKSLWGNMVLSMALQQDDQVQQINKKLGHVSGWVFASVGMISALSVAQGIDGLATLQQDPHPYHPPILGLVGSGLTLVSVVSQAGMIHRYKKQLLARQEEVADQVAHALEHLKNDGLTDHVQAELSNLIGSQGASEFLSLWQAAHPR